jgi:hypothetical protein
MLSALPSWQKVVVVVLALVGLLAIIAGIFYVALPAHSLPSFFPAHSASTKHGTKHGVAALVVGVVLIGVAIAVVLTRKQGRAPA